MKLLLITFRFIYASFISALNLTVTAYEVCTLTSRNGFYDDVDLDSDAAGISSQTVILKHFSAVSDIACSQKCFSNHKCSYKKYVASTNICWLMKTISLAEHEDSTITKKVVVKTTTECDAQPSSVCGDKCKCTATCGEHGYRCDCHVPGLSQTSSDFVHGSCDAALKANGDTVKNYFIQPSLQYAPVSVKCQKFNSVAYAVFNHNNEAETQVTGHPDGAGGYKFQFVYLTSMETIVFVINQSSSCAQYTKATCLGVEFVGSGKSWLNGRDGGKLRFWGGGPADGNGCACGITNTCKNVAYKCNCDINNNYGSEWTTDVGDVTAKDILPLTGIAIGDTGTANVEVVKYTVGPLRCII